MAELLSLPRSVSERRRSPVARVDDVAAAVLERAGEIDTWKLQKLVYYCQAWHLVWDGDALFADKIEAWADGPVVRKLYHSHKGSFKVSSWPRGDASTLTQPETETVDAVVEAYGHLSGRQLSHLTHSEAPWRDARAGLSPGERSEVEITKEAMAEYYRAVDSDPNAESVEAFVSDD
jgi:uncharacterized phage-associated protein